MVRPRLPLRWLRFRLRTLFLAATLLCCYLAWPHIARQYAFWRLSRYGDLSHGALWVEDPPSPWDQKPASPATLHIERLLQTILHPRSRLETIFLPSPWMIVRLSEGRTLIVLVQPPIAIPGAGFVRIVILDRL